MRPRRPRRENQQILEEASTWFVEMSEGEVLAEARREFDDWLRASPEHVRAYLKVAALWEDAPRLPRLEPAERERLFGAARREAHIAPLDRIPTMIAPPPERHRRPQVLRRHPLLAGSLLLGLTALAFWTNAQRGLYATGIGEQRSITLSDGSLIELDAHSRVRVELSPSLRAIELLEGQALFHVAKDHARPFIVRTGTASVRAVGTQFDVYRRAADTVVTVVEGQVAVSADASERFSGAPATPGPPSSTTPSPSRAADEQPTPLSAGQQLTLSPHARPLPQAADVAAALAWTERKLIYASSPLAQVVDEYNRYHEKPLRIRDEALEQMQVSGVFSASDDAALLAFLRAQPNVSVHDTDRDIEISSR